MALIEVVLPKMGESVMEATINTWLKKVGDSVEEEEPLLEVSTDKVDTEVPSAFSGVIKEILIEEGQVAQVGEPIAIINSDQENQSTANSSVTPKKEILKPASKKKGSVATEATASNGSLTNGQNKLGSVKSNRFYSPLVKNIAKEENISLEELEQVEGSGKDNRVTKADILSYIENKKSGGGVAVAKAPEEKVAQPKVEVSISAEDEIIEMDRMRKIIAERMVESRRISAHVQSFIEADVTPIVKWRENVKDDFLKATGEKLTFTPVFLDAIIKTIKDFPMINISVDGTNIIKHRKVNIGMAVALPTGNLIVPVIKNADQLNLVGLARKVNDLAHRARKNELNPDEVTGGTYTVTNVGGFGSVMGTPIILQPQVAIMAIGAIVKKPAVIETPDGDMIGIRHKMFLSHSYDHRVVDGMLGSMFAKRVVEYLESFDTSIKF